MSDQNGELLFAPDVPFSAVDLKHGRLPNQLYRRIAGFYLVPAMELAKTRHDFAAGLLVVCAADALGGFITGASANTARTVGFFQSIPGLQDPEVAVLFVDHFRHGLVHEARVKCGGKFSVEVHSVAERQGASLAVNPRLLAEAVHARLVAYRDQLNSNTAALAALKKTIRRRFATELKC